jgi:hypothetical protein
MDTTSHNFTWETFEFGGEHGSSAFYDVAIINENDIWAVGEIHTYETDTFDSLGNWVQPYNAVHWDGEKWELKRINGHGSKISVILAFSPTDIWYNGLLHWNGSIYKLRNKNFPLLPNGEGWVMNKMWGTSSSDLYVVGNKGMIAHYDGHSWAKVESGTTFNFSDIWGVDQERVLLSGNRYQPQLLSKIFFLTQMSLSDDLFWNNSNNVWSVWGKVGTPIFAAGLGVYKRMVNGKWILLPDTKKTRISTIRGVDTNNIIVGGDFGFIRHYNGMNWLEFSFNLSRIESICFQNNIAAAVGSDGYHAVLIISKR